LRGDETGCTTLRWAVWRGPSIVMKPAFWSTASGGGSKTTIRGSDEKISGFCST
jgi:hypothetical protein